MVSFTTKRLYIKEFSNHDVSALCTYHTQNESFHTPYEPNRPDLFYTSSYWAKRIKQQRDLFLRDLGLYLGIFLPNHTLIGTIDCHTFHRGSTQSCYIGYNLDKNHTGKGYMTESLEALCAFLFKELHFHTIFACYLPTNTKSAALLQRLSFTIVGTIPDYQFQQNQWLDHVLCCKTNRNT